MTFDQFISQWSGKGLDYDHYGHFVLKSLHGIRSRLPQIWKKRGFPGQKRFCINKKRCMFISFWEFFVCKNKTKKRISSQGNNGLSKKYGNRSYKSKHTRQQKKKFKNSNYSRELKKPEKTK